MNAEHELELCLHPHSRCFQRAVRAADLAAAADRTRALAAPTSPSSCEEEASTVDATLDSAVSVEGIIDKGNNLQMQERLRSDWCQEIEIVKRMMFGT